MYRKVSIFLALLTVTLLFIAATEFALNKEKHSKKILNYVQGIERADKPKTEGVTKNDTSEIALQVAPESSPEKETNLSSLPPPKKYIKFLFLGDIMMGRYVRTLMEKNKDLDYPFKKARDTTTPNKATNFLHGYFDRVIANLEGPIVPVPNRSQTGTTFGFAPDTAEIVKRNGIDLVSIANNHTLDQGQKGLESTQKYLAETGLPFFGHPILPTEKDVRIETIYNKKFAFIGFHDATRRLDDAAARSLIEKIDPQVDYTIIFIHWGPEYQKNPSKRQEQLAHLFIDAGADLVIGHHPHIPQTRETYKGVPIIYSLGNFIFDQYWSDMTQHGLTVEAVFSTDPSDATIQLYEHPIDLYKSQPVWR